MNQKDVSPTRFAQNVQSLVEKTLKQAHPGVEIDPNVVKDPLSPVNKYSYQKMQIDVQLQRLAERRPVVEARNVITPLPLEVHFSRPTVSTLFPFAPSLLQVVQSKIIGKIQQNPVSTVDNPFLVKTNILFLWHFALALNKHS